MLAILVVPDFMNHVEFVDAVIRRVFHPIFSEFFDKLDARVDLAFRPWCRSKEKASFPSAAGLWCPDKG
jgi:hypothetical protein